MGAAAGGEGEVVRVLVVDDSPVDRRVVELLLRNHANAFHFTTVDNGKKAMELLGLNNAQGKQRSIDMVLTDYCMPEMTGYDLLQAIKPASLTNRCLTAGAEDYIVKPLRTKDVQRLRNCSAARPATKDATVADDRRRSSVKKNDDAPAPPRPDTAAKRAISDSEQRPRRLAGLAMASTVDLSHYLQFLFKFILLAYVVLGLAELLHRSSNGCFLSLW
ncbi:hypothetical protein ACQ4PT_067174 [Festuca glaucescens]